MVSPRTASALTLALMTILALATGPASAAVPTDGARAAVSRSAQSQQTAYKDEALRATNSARLRRDLDALDSDQCLQRFAAQQAKTMAQQESMFHQDLGPVMRECGVFLAGENVAFGFASGHDVVQGWMNSPGHRANILNRGYRLVAVAARESASGRWYAAQVFGRR